jgi:hypothetical protein
MYKLLPPDGHEPVRQEALATPAAAASGALL